MRVRGRPLYVITTAVSILLFVSVLLSWVCSFWLCHAIVYEGPYHTGLACGGANGHLMLFDYCGIVGEWDGRGKPPVPREWFVETHPAAKTVGLSQYHPITTAGFAWSNKDFDPWVTKRLWVPYWFVLSLLAAAGWLSSRPLRRAALAGRRARRGLCPACGYDLRGSGDRCPECGTTAVPPPGDAVPA